MPILLLVKGHKKLSVIEARAHSAGLSLLFGGADKLGVVLMRAEVGGSEVASSSSSITLAFTVAAEEEESESSMISGKFHEQQRHSWWQGYECD